MKITYFNNQQSSFFAKKFKETLDQEKNKLTSTSSYTQPAPPPQPSLRLRRKKIRIYCFDIPHRKFTITLEYKYWYQWTLIQSTQTNKSTINGYNIETIIPTDSNFKYDVRKKSTQRSNLWIQVLDFDLLTKKTEELSNENNKLKS